MRGDLGAFGRRQVTEGAGTPPPSVPWVIDGRMCRSVAWRSVAQRGAGLQVRVREGKPEEARAPVLEGIAGEALREAARCVHGRGQLPWRDRPARDAPAKHGVAHVRMRLHIDGEEKMLNEVLVGLRS